MKCLGNRSAICEYKPWNIPVFSIQSFWLQKDIAKKKLQGDISFYPLYVYISAQIPGWNTSLAFLCFIAWPHGQWVLGKQKRTKLTTELYTNLTNPMHSIDNTHLSIDTKDNMGIMAYICIWVYIIILINFIPDSHALLTSDIHFLSWWLHVSLQMMQTFFFFIFIITCIWKCQILHSSQLRWGNFLNEGSLPPNPKQIKSNIMLYKSVWSALQLGIFNLFSLTLSRLSSQWGSHRYVLVCAWNHR